jgi:hypothetical protein
MEKWIVTRPDEDFLAEVEAFAEPRWCALELSLSVYARASSARGRVTRA